MKKGLISADSIPPFGLKPTTKQKSNRRAARRAPLALRIGLVVLAATLALGVGIIRLSSSSAAGTISLTTIGMPYTQNFDTLASSGTSSTLPAGWEFVEALANANTTYTGGTGSGNAGDTYSFGATASTERAFGGLQSGTLNPTIGASFTNNTGTTVSSLAVSYPGEQWRLGATARVDRLDFQISTDATSVATGTWTDFNALDFTAPVTAGTVGALNGNVAPNRTPVSATIAGLNIPNGATFFVQWTDLNAAGADDGL